MSDTFIPLNALLGPFDVLVLADLVDGGKLMSFDNLGRYQSAKPARCEAALNAMAKYVDDQDDPFKGDDYWLALEMACQSRSHILGAVGFEADVVEEFLGDCYALRQVRKRVAKDNRGVQVKAPATSPATRPLEVGKQINHLSARSEPLQDVLNLATSEGRKSLHSVWTELKRLATEEEPIPKPLLGFADDEGIKYLLPDGSVAFFTLNALKQRLKRRK